MPGSHEVKELGASRDRGKLLPWSDLAVNGTGSYAISLARVHYAQSCAMVTALVQAYGTAKVAQYVRSFRVPFEKADSVKLARSFTANFKAVFGVPWEEAVALLARAPAR